jgi:hypothetical protein
VWQGAGGTERLLQGLGISIAEFGSLMHTPPFDAVLDSLTRLSSTADAVRHNQENCERVRRRAATLLPVVVAVWRRVKADGGAMASSVEVAMREIRSVLEEQTELVTVYLNDTFLAQGHTSASFKAGIERTDTLLSHHLTTLTLALEEQQAVDVRQILEHARSLTVELNPRLDELMRRMVSMSEAVERLRTDLTDSLRQVAERSAQGPSVNLCCRCPPRLALYHPHPPSLPLSPPLSPSLPLSPPLSSRHSCSAIFSNSHTLAALAEPRLISQTRMGWF